MSHKSASLQVDLVKLSHLHRSRCRLQGFRLLSRLLFYSACPLIAATHQNHCLAIYAPPITVLVYVIFKDLESAMSMPRHLLPRLQAHDPVILSSPPLYLIL
ncbi:unnamed protein product [Protopolystoma xenopodis]|uniref:Uncharacterized protein n=1 Tax=Protopolystoma xenopodis TaxID=117903 RepID=A0A3S5AR80_9PLAT|nr:unnamed protein product [Protopolystoma xenopodis]